MLTAWIYCRKKKLPISKAFDLTAPALALGQAIGRWGNFFNQEAHGAAVENPALQFFPLAVHIEGSGWHWATFFYESLWCFLIVVFILAAEKKRFFRRSGDAFGAYIFLYGIERALVEGLRTDSLYLGPFRVSQLLSLGLVLFVCIIIGCRAKRVPVLLRALPAANVLLLCGALAMDAGMLSAVLALAQVSIALTVYIISSKKGEEREIPR